MITGYIGAGNIDQLISSLEEVCTLFKWSANDRLKANVDKCYLLFSGTQKANIKIGNFCIGYSECEKLLGLNLAVVSLSIKTFWTCVKKQVGN